MKKTVLSLTLAAALGMAMAETPTVSVATAPAPAASSVVDAAKAAVAKFMCSDCGTVEEVKEETRKGKGGVLGKVGGAIAGGLLGNQVGGGTGKTVATVGGAIGGAVIGNEIEKKMTSKKVWVTSVKLRDGTVKKFEQEAKPTWTAGQVLKVEGDKLTAL